MQHEATSRGSRLALLGLNGTQFITIHFSPGAQSVQKENGPRGGAVPKGPLLRRHTGPGIPAPRSSRREPPINWARHYPAAGNAVKAILAHLTGTPARYRGGAVALPPAHHHAVKDAGRRSRAKSGTQGSGRRAEGNQPRLSRPRRTLPPFPRDRQVVLEPTSPFT